MLLGVVEGFYNRPWNEDQRLDLFKKLSAFGCNAYVYAPKDDARHRTHWRDPDDLSGLQTLLEAAKREGVRFFYGISPGLDVLYSSKDDLEVLKRKLDRLREIGCNGFALLWDDIDTCLQDPDKEVFSSIGHAHACVSNEIFNHVSSDDVEFLMCPLEYCASRADPDVSNSYYLLTLGELLHPDIGVFWTGSHVVSEVITLEEIRGISEVLRRKPVLWENLHANDYDAQRIFMGPYYGRDPEIIPHIRGVLTNPNCEYSSNVPALYTLSKWASLGDKYDPFAAAEECQEEVIKELYRPCPPSSLPTNERMMITKADIDLLMQTFWLPYAHGPKIELLLKEFEYLRDHSHIARSFIHRGAAAGVSVSSMGETDENIQTSFIDDWISRVYTFNEVCRSFGGLFEKLPFIPNRDFFFDINPYLNSVQVALLACNRYLKWVGLDQCANPLLKGPTLAGLPGGLAGELMRLYPVQSQCEFPLLYAPAYLEKKTLVLRPIIQSNLQKFTQSLNFLSTLDYVLVDALLYSKDSVFTYGALLDSKPLGLIFASNRINAFKEGLKCDNAYSDFPNNGSILGFVVENQLLFTKSMDLMLEVVSEWMESSSQFSIIPRYSVLTKTYLQEKDFRPLDDDDKSNSKYIILKKRV
eukprot:TRINITY_DN5243_c0_g1_i1.p1 TRINITY_DN5243_c0_g1~~TRINITY_DN5243_c0_g1_i1.p1  ORF type:complete len:654 (-),score=214.63 TRINITY_DN5243_c0_g1_i1:148-2070(-)